MVISRLSQYGEVFNMATIKERKRIVRLIDLQDKKNALLLERKKLSEESKIRRKRTIRINNDLGRLKKTYERYAGFKLGKFPLPYYTARGVAYYKFETVGGVGYLPNIGKWEIYNSRTRRIILSEKLIFAASDEVKRLYSQQVDRMERLTAVGLDQVVYFLSIGLQAKAYKCNNGLLINKVSNLVFRCKLERTDDVGVCGIDVKRNVQRHETSQEA